MPITTYSDGDKETFRAQMLEGVRRNKATNPDYTVVDIGGRFNPWADELVDAYVDVFHFDTDKKLYVGDVNSEDIWRQLEADGPFDFVIISHVLEDIRDAITPLNWLPRVAKFWLPRTPPSSIANSATGVTHTGWGSPIITGYST